MMYHNISSAAEQNKHRFRWSEKPGEACHGWCCSGAQPWAGRAAVAGDARRRLVNEPVSAEWGTV